jgi:multicomponent Na+:H+ antiporter subunit G
MNWFIYLLFGTGMVFQGLGTLALHRFPDVYTRLHGATKCTTFGSLFIYLGVIVYGVMMILDGNPSFVALPFHTAIIMLFILITNPTGAHAIARAAHRTGIMPKHAVIDELRGAGK